DDGSLLAPLPDDQGNQADGSDDDQSRDEAGSEPIVFLALVEQHLQGSDAEREEGNADVIQFDAGGFEAAQIGWIFDKAANQKPGEQANRQIDEENPAPGIVEGDPTAEGWPDGWRHDRRDAIQREGQATLLGRKGVGQNGLGHGL